MSPSLPSGGGIAGDGRVLSTCVQVTFKAVPSGLVFFFSHIDEYTNISQNAVFNHFLENAAPQMKSELNTIL